MNLRLVQSKRAESPRVSQNHFGRHLPPRLNEVIKIKFSMKDCQMCPSRSLCTQSIRHTRRTVGENKKRPRNFSRPMLSERGLRAPSRKASGSWGCAVPAISGRRRRICNTSPRLPLSIWFAVWHGSMVFLALRLDALPLLAFMTWLRRVRQWSILKTATKNKRSPPGQSLSGCVFHSHQPCSPFASSGCGLWW
jgi:hypothetical protein